MYYNFKGQVAKTICLVINVTKKKKNKKMQFKLWFLSKGYTVNLQKSEKAKKKNESDVLSENHLLCHHPITLRQKSGDH